MEKARREDERKQKESQKRWQEFQKQQEYYDNIERKRRNWEAQSTSDRVNQEKDKKMLIQSERALNHQVYLRD